MSEDQQARLLAGAKAGIEAGWDRRRNEELRVVYGGGGGTAPVGGEQSVIKVGPGAVALPAVIEPAAAEPDGAEARLRLLNAQHAVIDNVGGRTVIASLDPSPLDPTKRKIVFQSKTDFLLRYSNRTVSMEIPNAKGGYNSVEVPLGQWWLAHPKRKQYHAVTFLPGGPPVLAGGCFNLWQGWGVEPREGDWSLIAEHIEKVVACGNEVLGNYVFAWIAWGIQNPDKQAEVALVLIGDKGSGKGTIARCLQRIFGHHAFQVTSRDVYYRPHVRSATPSQGKHRPVHGCPL